MRVQVESCTYSLGFPLGNPVPRWFRSALRNLSPDDLRRFLIAVMHTPSLPNDAFGMAQVRATETLPCMLRRGRGCAAVILTCSTLPPWPQIHVVMSNRTGGYLVSFGGFGHVSVPSYETREELEAELHKFVRATC